MTPEQLTTAQSVLSLINTGGVTAVLVLIAVGFYTGKIIPRSVLDDVLKSYNEQIAEMTKKIIERIDKKDGW